MIQSTGERRALGRVLAREGENTRAITELQTALRLNPDNAESRQQLDRLQQNARQSTTTH